MQPVVNGLTIQRAYKRYSVQAHFPCAELWPGGGALSLLRHVLSLTE